MPNYKRRASYKAIITRILEGEGNASTRERQAAFENTVFDKPLNTLLNKVALQPKKIIDEDVEKLIASGLSEDQIFELIICVAVGQSSRQYEAAINALTEAAANK